MLELYVGDTIPIECTFDTNVSSYKIYLIVKETADAATVIIDYEGSIGTLSADANGYYNYTFTIPDTESKKLASYVGQELYYYFQTKDGSSHYQTVGDGIAEIKLSKNRV